MGKKAAKRYRARVGMTYPAPESMRLVRKRGGISKLSEEEREGLTMVTVAAGDTCSPPKESIPWLLEAGAIEELRPKKKAAEES